MEEHRQARLGLAAGASIVLGLGLLAGLLWLVLAEDERRAPAPSSAPHALESASAPSAVPLQEPPRAEPEPAAPVLAAAPSVETRASASGARADELERAIWVEGHVLFPPGTPADEAAFVLARGKEFADGSLQRAPVAADGSFRVAFSERSKTGWLLLEARYAYLEQNYRWKKSDPARVFLEPKLGGCIEGRVVTASDESAFVGGRVGCVASSSGALSLGMGNEALRELRGERTFTFGGLPPGDARVRYEGEDFWARALTPRIEPGAVARLELELVTGAELAGLVTWPDGRPAAGARVAAAAEDRAEETRIVTGFTSPLAPGEGEVLTGADGSFRLSGLQPGRYRVLARAAVMEPSASVPVFWKAVSAAVPGDTLDLALVLDAGLSVTGTTRDEGAAPLAGVAILARPSLEEARVDDLVVGTSKADGSFALTGLAPGAWELDVSLEGYARLEKRLVLPSSVPLELVLLRGAIVSGFVQDEEHVLLPGASVSAQGASGAWGQTDARGAFELAGLTAGTSSLQAEAEGFAPSAPLELELAENEVRRDVVLRVRRGGDVVGEVLDHEGKPVARAVVRAEAAQQTGSAAQCDANGRFEFKGLLPGEVRLEATLFNGLLCGARVTVLAGETVRVRLQAPEFMVHLHGRVRIGGSPAAGAYLQFRRRESDVGAFGRMSEPDGSYALDLPGPGSYWIGVQSADSGTFQWIALDVPRMRDFEHDLEFAVGRVSGRVFAKDGTPLSGVWVVAHQSSDQAERSGWSSAASGEDGRYELVLPPATYELVAGGDRGDADPERSFARAQVADVVVAGGAELRGIDFVLELGATLEGVVRWGDGTAAVEAELWIGPQGKVVESEPLGKADALGHFRVEGLPAGKVVVTATLGLGTAEWQKLELVPGATQRFELVLAASSWLEVRVRERSGLAVAAEVHVLDARQKSFGAVQAEGPLARLGPLPSGRYQVRARVGERTAEGEVEITGKEDAKTLELVLD